MKRQGRFIVVLLLASAVGAWADDAPVPPRDRVAVEILARSRLLENVRFQLPVDLYRQYLQETGQPLPPPAAVTVPAVRCALRLDRDRAARLDATVELLVLDADRAGWIGVLDSRVAWDRVAVDGKAAVLPAADGLLRLPPQSAGRRHVVSASAALDRSPPAGGGFALAVPPAVQTSVDFDSPGAWDVSADDGFGRLSGNAAGTHGRLVLSSRDRVAVRWSPPTAAVERPPHFMLRGNVAWNLDAGSQQVTADLTVTIAAGASDRIELTLPARADRVRIAGPEVRSATVAAGRATVNLRGRVLGAVALRVEFEMPVPAGRDDARSLSGLGLADGRWLDGTLLISNTAGGSEVLAGRVAGLEEIALSQAPRSAAAILPGPAALAYRISAASFSAEVEVLELGAFALRQSIADLAHYELFVSADGSAIGRVRYEVRNRNQQYLTLRMPPAARVLSVRVNEADVPLLARPDEPGAWRVRLERSTASVIGLVSFPVDVAWTMRVDLPRQAKRASLTLPLPRIDLPVAYAWCELFLPGDVRVRRIGGPLRPVAQYSSQTATESLDYGLGALAEGYDPAARPTAPPVVEEQTDYVSDLSPLEEDRPPHRPETPANQPSAQPIRTSAGRSPAPVPATQPDVAFSLDSSGSMATNLLARNYWRAGKDSYDRGDLANAAEALGKVVELAPRSAEAENARRLLANTEVLEGGYEYRSKSERAAGAAVQKQAAEKLSGQFERQGELLEQARKEFGEGKVSSAKAKLQAARSMGRQLSGQLGGNAELRLREQTAGRYFEQIEKQESTEAAELSKRFDELKQTGQTDEALRVGKKLLALNVEFSDEVREAMEQLVVASVRPSADLAPVQTPADSAEQARRLVLKPKEELTHEDFAQARRLIAAARPPAEGDKLKAELDDLEKFVSNTEADWNAYRVKLDQQIAQRQQAEALRPERDRRGLPSVREGLTPYDDGIVYPRPELWHKITEQRKPFEAGTPPESPSNQRVLEMMQRAIPEIRFQEIAFETALSFLRDLQRVNINPNWDAMAQLGVLPTTKVTLNLRDAVFETVLRELLTKAAGRDGLLDYMIRDGVVKVSTRDDLASIKYIRVYDVRDLLHPLSDFRAPRPKRAGNDNGDDNGNEGGGLFGDDEDDNAPADEDGQAKTNDFLGLIRTTVRPDSWSSAGGEGDVTETDGLLVVKQTANAHRDLAKLLDQLREVRGPQVDTRANRLAEQRAWDQADRKLLDPLDREETSEPQIQLAARNAQELSPPRPLDPELRGFIERNYANSDGEQDVWLRADLVRKLADNLSQKVVVNSMNLNVAPPAARALGVRFEARADGRAVAAIDEAQFRALRELDVNGKARPEAPVQVNGRRQETIVGTDAVLANGMLGNVAFAADRFNDFLVDGTPVRLEHERYLLVDNGGYLTVMRAGPMQHWTEPAADVRFPDAPLVIETPRLGELHRLEKTLMSPTDEAAVVVEFDVNPHSFRKGH